MAANDFAGWTVVVTGASTGLGRAIAVETAQRGAALVVVNYASSADDAAETARQCEAAGAKAVLVQGDVGEDADCIRIAEAAAPSGRIDALFNNAGVTKFAPNHADLDAVTADDFMRLYRVNVIGAYQMVRACRSLLEAAPQPGAVVNTASIAGVTGIGSSVPYAASKGAMTTLTLSLARALAPRIRVNAICPGFIDTPWFGKGMPEASVDRLRAGAAAATPLKVASTAEDIAASAVFLGSTASRHITGETLLVDAGSHLGYAPMGMR
ncbi:NAD(P)-dependent dehydrogenase (short-subunit alcohol dehydrogenase family) [Caulobacter ginsengisoli]|uniref:NAD(P)-dependent dehydrogenase (Short-subunit alcohol dehydrogenase family) n=1 Tax=Caulobacter ginsengisoli TaxID=400775 RepID=A0ABU0IKE8_9CAUL|nr:SDR family NAD(P)-dependent oxidoreductase [Caulobacter ginsengisoli]MDQ0462491.1 NAD(P)-dependent dehydrogenase (short-subunit alcohol dehydrogenase family) [Caulobacter ginsengisoli]